MAYFIDRRLNGKNKSAVNRQRFLRRYKAQIKQSISGAINKRSVTDVDSGESVSIPIEDINEPMFHQGRGGLRHRVHPGNDHFVQNDRIERPQGGGGGGGSGQGQASQDGEGQDEFVFQISKDEYLDLLFEDLALPNLKRNQHRQITEFKSHRAGFTSNGVPANISVVRSLQNSLARRTAMSAGKRRLLHELEESLDTVSRSEPAQLLEEERLAERNCRAAGKNCPRAVYRHLRSPLQELRETPGTFQPGGDVLPDGRFRFDGPGDKRHGQALLYPALSVPEPDLQKRGGGLYSPPYPGQRGGRTRVLLLAGNRRDHCFQRPEADG